MPLNSKLIFQESLKYKLVEQCYIVRITMRVFMSLAQLEWTMHKICKVQGSNL